MKFHFSQCFLLLMIIGLARAATSCSTGEADPVYRERMRAFVEAIADHSRKAVPGFIVIPQNGIELITSDGEPEGDPELSYLDAISGVGQEDLFYGYRQDDRATPESETEYLISYLRLCEANGTEVLVTDYCSSNEKTDDSYAQSAAEGFISFAAPDRELGVIPGYPATVYQFNNEDVNSLSEAKNFLYLINPENFASRTDLISDLAATAYDLFIIDLFFGEAALSEADIASLKNKPQGGSRLVIAYMSIGEAEDYRYYWDPSWESYAPEWLLEENPDWEGNYKVKYWNHEWQSIIYGDEEAYLDQILSRGFDGVYLDIIEAFEYFE